MGRESVVASGDLSPDIAFLSRFGFREAVLASAQNRARILDTQPARTLIATGTISERDYYRCAAIHLGLQFSETTKAIGRPFLILPTPEGFEDMARMVRVSSHPDFVGPNDIFHIVPDMSKSVEIKAWLARNPELADRLRVSPPQANQASLLQRASSRLQRFAADGYSTRYPHLSARTVITPSQAIVLVLLIQCLLALIFWVPGSVSLAAHLTASSFFIACVALRLSAAVTFATPRSMQAIKDVPDRDLPVYSIIVPLYREAGQIPDLVDALCRLDWPRELLDIKLVCETRDPQTIAACEFALREKRISHICVVEVPPGGPSTKPKALRYALPFCIGEFIVVYDAEDRPHPAQLREALSEFRRQSSEIACLQSPLIIHNGRESWWSRMFAVEYSALFNGLLPMLSRWDSPIPLGGTSNHFRRSALTYMGGWDPHNVTEDADIGIRLARNGLKTKTIAAPTLEEAPITFTVWLNQRTRWFKGWYQTWLVHMRHPRSTLADLGVWGFLMFQILTVGMAVSALVHPWLLWFLGAGIWEAWQSASHAPLVRPLFLLDVGTVVFGYLSYSCLAWRTLSLHGQRRFRKSLWAVPFYWLAISFAAWRAVLHLIVRPFEWDKTPHHHRLRREPPVSQRS